MTDDRLHRYAHSVTADAADPAITAAFAQVPRDHFVTHVVDPGSGEAITVTPELVYSDEALVTRLCDGRPSSSSSQPSLMARMLAALTLRPGLAVLEIGAGTGYNAALVAAITGAPVVTVDIQPDVVAQARAALDRAGATGVTVQLGDGFFGAPAHGPYDRIIATVGVGGVPQPWLDQLRPDGVIVAPVEHGGLQPCLRMRFGPDRRPVGRGAVASGFMLAAGRLHPPGGPPPALVLPSPLPAVAMPRTADQRYYDLWFALAARDPRIERRSLPGAEPAGAVCTLADPTDGAVLIGRDALHPVGATPGLVEQARALVEGWHAAGQPPLTAWRCDFALADARWTPANWRLSD